MSKSVVFLFVAILLAAMLSGCLISKTPSTNSVAMTLGQQMTFSMKVLPSNATYTWTLDGLSLSNTEKSYVYTAEAGEHILIIEAKHILGTDKQTWSIQVNSPPVANAGADQSIAIDTIGTLNGSGSTDPDNDRSIASYLWQQTGGPLVTLNNADTVVAQFTAAVAVGSVLTFELTVTDTAGLLSTDTCVITVTNLIDPISVLLSSMVRIPVGTFMMGSTDNEYNWAQYTTPVHAVTLQAFEIGAYEVTQAQYAAVMGTNPSYFQGTNYPFTENNPVEWVTWYEAREFCTQLSALTGRTFTLPSEAQWEYACRAGTTTLYSTGDDDGLLDNYSWNCLNSSNTTHPVGTKLPNPWGLYDMHGNVWEWCLDSWHTNYTGAPTDGSAWEPEIGTYRLFRGGSWLVFAKTCRSAYRSYYYPIHWSSGLGFRVVAIPAGG